MAKILVRAVRCCTATMLIRHAEQQLGTLACVRDGPGQSAPAPPMRIPDCGESILHSHVSGRLRVSDTERSTLAEIRKRLGRKCLAEVACVAKPETILAWYRRLIARKFDGSRQRSYAGRPRIRPRSGSAHRPHGPGEQRMGLRSCRWRSRQPRPSTVRSDNRKYPEAPRHPASTET